VNGLPAATFTNHFKIMAKKSVSKPVGGLTVLNPNAAGIDIGSMEHYVAVGGHLVGPGQPTVRPFGADTEGLRQMCQWLRSCGVDKVAMETTGVYWLGVYEMLEQEGFEASLVHAKYVKNVPGRKSDVGDCQWIQQLHSYGLLTRAFVPADKVRELRCYVRHRNTLEREKADSIRRMHKALDMMNVKVHHLVTDMAGVAGMGILRAIAAGETDSGKLSGHHVKRMKATKEELRRSLEGNYRAEHVFSLRQCLSAFDFYEGQMGECDQQIEQVLAALTEGVLPEVGTGDGGEGGGWLRPKEAYARKNEYRFDAKWYIKEMTGGVDLTEIEGLDENTVLTILAETGLDMGKWKSHKHFTSWLRLAPQPKVSGGKVVGHARPKSSNRANQAFRMAAQCMKASQSALGAFYRKMRARKGPAIAIKATAKKIATIFYLMMSKGEQYVKKSAESFEETQRLRLVRKLSRQAEQLGLVLQKGEEHRAGDGATALSH